MLEALIQFRALLSGRDITRMWWLLGIVIATGFLEVAGIASVVPFLQLAANPDSALQRPWLLEVYTSLGLDTHQSMLIATGCAVIAFLAVSNLLAILAGWLRQRIAWTIAHNVSLSLAESYTRLPYAFYLHRDSADLIKSVIDDVNSLVNGVVLAGCQFISQSVIVSMILLLLAAVNPWVAISALGVFAGIYFIIYLARRRLLTRLGRERLSANSDRYVAFVDLMTGIKAIKSDGASDYFLKRFERPSRLFAATQPRIHLSSSVPRHIVETVAFGAVISIILVLSRDEQTFVQALPTLTLFALAGYRLMPAINTAYVSMAQIASSYPAIETIYRDVHAAPATPTQPVAPMALQEAITLHDLSFQYPESDHPVLSSITLTIRKGQKVAFVGPSGSGKTTLIDILTGMLSPDVGTLRVDDTPITPANAPDWQRIIGYVPQEVFLYNDTIERNIAFGTEPIDIEKIRQVAQIAQIAETIESTMPDGYQTTIGERGLRLSGGQRQRLGLARALYRSPQVLVLDEATSALDSQTEARVIAAIHDELPELTIVMIAHRLSTVRRCDWLYVLDRGELVAQNTYQALLANDALFRDLARID